MNNYDFNKIYNMYLNTVNQSLNNIFSEDSPAVNDSMRYSIMAGGKRIRPVLALASCDICGGNYKKALLFACALEIVHTYSLIYDDMPCMDNDKLRRGKPTNHIVYGEDVALLAGMGLYSRAFEIILNNYKNVDLSEIQAIDACKILLNASGINGIVMGQYYDIENVSANAHVDIDYLSKVHKLKTSAMLEASVLMGAVAADADENSRNSLLNYAKCLGLAFQIRDDILDVIGTESNMGKSIGKDKNSKKITFVDVYGIEAAQQKVTDLTLKAKESIKNFSDNMFLNDLADMLCKRNK